jgi:hypothetical protein
MLSPRAIIAGPNHRAPEWASLPARTPCQQRPGAKAHLVTGNTPGTERDEGDSSNEIHV